MFVCITPYIDINVSSPAILHIMPIFVLNNIIVWHGGDSLWMLFLIFFIILPDDTSKLESIFINEFFVNSSACKAVAQMPMALALSKNDDSYISISRSSRNITLEYIRNHEIVVSKMYDSTSCDTRRIIEDAKILHIDLEYRDVPVYVNNFNMNMEEFFEMGEIISPKQFMEKIAVIDVEKL